MKKFKAFFVRLTFFEPYKLYKVILDLCLNAVINKFKKKIAQYSYI
ncbi:hypothetical protein SAMN05443663_105224 [Flavobacterium defluvii]|uniref:Uncharacterized protein n=1 Tax=Flavobacterium defluvii TaxID=370979 RepID=A0A1M5Q4C1_9FLAO|nr:hypothetical protein SAMN05443663_105224 [Flavobacterium defluvii]